jgi:hypothetical protein
MKKNADLAEFRKTFGLTSLHPPDVTLLAGDVLSA